MSGRNAQNPPHECKEKSVSHAATLSTPASLPRSHGLSRAGRLALSALPDVEIKWDEPLARHTTFRIGGTVACFARPLTEAALENIVREVREHDIPYLILGGGSNVLPPDNHLDVLVIQLTHSCSSILSSQSGATGGLQVNVGAGVRVAQLMRFCVAKGLGGLECLAGIPGTVGGALIMNAGTREGSIGESLIWIDALHGEGKRLRVHKSELGVSYRSMGLPKDWIILGGCLEMQSSTDRALRARLLEIMLHRKVTQPLGLPSAGCIFKNPLGRSAGALIDRSGLKGFRIGDAQISEKHANWIINIGNARAEDVIALVQVMEERVLGNFGIRLEREIQVLGEFGNLGI